METPYKRFYLDFDSTYRNRTLWPNAGEFGVSLARSCTCTAATAVDPISRATPLLAWTSNLFTANVPASVSVNGTVLGTGVGATNSRKIVIFQTAPGALQQSYNYYIHAVFGGTTPPLDVARIVEYKYLGNDTGLVKIDGETVFSTGNSVAIFDPTSIADPSNGLLFVPGGGEGNDDYFGQVIYNETLNEHRTVTGYDNDTGLLTVGLPPIPTWLATHNFSIRPEIPLLFTTAGGASTANNIVITGGSTITNSYRGSFVRVVAQQYTNTLTPPESEIRRITAYNGTTQVATVFPPFSASAANMKIEVLQFSYDNATTFTYKGTFESEPSIYAIRLMSMSLPNRILEGGNGGRIAYYPFVYVELTPSNIPSNNLIISNNPNAVKMMFKASLNNIQNIRDATFTHLKGDDMVQVFLFKVDTEFKVRVILPGGETFKTTDIETVSPAAPNPVSQISMLFELYRG